MAYKDVELICHSPSAKRIVAFLLSQDKPMKHSEVAHALGLATHTVNALVGQLRRHGYLERVVRVTHSGKELLSQ
jgi:Mn-dependent DtxR family transcriptional regulator